jgi:DNA-binding NarL/FixJ family response regulator
MKHTKIVIADDHGLVVQALSSLFEQEKSLKVVATAECGKSTLEQIVKQQPDLLILDLNLPMISGEELLPIFKKAYPRMKVLVLTASQIKQTWQKVLTLGADGIALKSIQSQALLNGVTAIVRGEMYVDPDIQAQLAQPDSGAYLTLPKTVASKVTKREEEILLLVLNDLTSKQIADILGISDRTVSKHRENIYKRMGVRTTSELHKQVEAIRVSEAL